MVAAQSSTEMSRLSANAENLMSKQLNKTTDAPRTRQTKQKSKDQKQAKRVKHQPDSSNQQTNKVATISQQDHSRRQKFEGPTNRGWRTSFRKIQDSNNSNNSKNNNNNKNHNPEEQSPPNKEYQLNTRQSDEADQQQQQQMEAQQQGANSLQVSITPRVGLVRVPVESNVILKCLISSQANKFTSPFRIRWSRFIYHESVYEQIESSTGLEDDLPPATSGLMQTTTATTTTSISTTQTQSSGPASETSTQTIGSSDQRSRRQSQGPHLDQEESSEPAAALEQLAPVNRQEQLRELLRRSRQETNVINDLLIEATLSISPVKASDNATYYCSASEVRGSPMSLSAGLARPTTSSNYETTPQHLEQRARIDLLVLSKPVVKLDRVQAARDSHSALVFWWILNDGNTPIKRTILMVKNESNFMAPTGQAAGQQQSPGTHFGSSFASGLGGRPGGAQATKSVVIDQDHQQWQKIDILGEGERVDGRWAAEWRSSASAAAGEQARTQSRLLVSTSDDSDVVRASLDREPAGQLDNEENFNASSSSPRGRQPTGSRTARGQQRVYNLTGLLPGVSYRMRLAAINDMGQSEWSHLAALMPNDIPAQIHEVFVLNQSNDSITIGWRRPPWDGAKTIRYEMQLFDLNRTMTLDANTNTTGQLRTNYMFHFVNLQPGTDYHFHIRACSRAGCSAYSQPKLFASTLDGEPDEPLDVELQCTSFGSMQPVATVSWLPPRETRGRLSNYSLQFQWSAHFRNQSGLWQHEEWHSIIETGDNHTLSLELPAASNGAQMVGDNEHQLAPVLLLPNTNYSVRVCANNRSKGCGKLSAVTNKSQCHIGAQLPAQVPMNEIRFALGNLDELQSAQLNSDTLANLQSTSNQEQQQPGGQLAENGQKLETLFVEFAPFSWRNGSIDCIQVALIRLPQSFDGSNSRPLSDFLPDDPADIQLHEYMDLIARVDGGAASWPAGDSSPEGRELQAEQRTPPKSDAKAATEQQRQVLEFKQNRAFAYLAEELDADAVWPPGQSVGATSEGQRLGAAAATKRRVTLGDGRQFDCRSVWAQQAGRAPESRLGSGLDTRARVESRLPSVVDSGDKSAQEKARDSFPRPLDGSLAEETFYTGFLKLVQVRKRRASGEGGREQRKLFVHKVEARRTRQTAGRPLDESAALEEDQIELVSKYSAYFSPVKTGKRVPDVPFEMLLAQRNNQPNGNHEDEQLARDGGGLHQNGYLSGGRKSNSAIDLAICRWQPLIDVQAKLFGSTRACRMLSELSDTVRRNVVSLSRGLVNSFTSTGTGNSSVQANSLARLMQQGSVLGQSEGPMQVLQVGIFVMIFSLLLLFIIYLFTLPAAMRRRRKQKQLRAQHNEGCFTQETTSPGGQQKQAASPRADQEAEKQSANQAEVEDETGGFARDDRNRQGVQAGCMAAETQAGQLNPYQQRYQQEPPRVPAECHIHSSPNLGHRHHHHHHHQEQQSPRSEQAAEQDDEPYSVHQMAAHEQPQSSVHLCQAKPEQQQQQAYQEAVMRGRHEGHFEAHNNLGSMNGGHSMVAMDYARNCKTLRRMAGDTQKDLSNSMIINNGNHQNEPYEQHLQHSHHHQHQHQVHDQRSSMTLQHGTGSGSLNATILALAKKINKSIPLALFHSVLDCRLRNGWLREEFEQLPRFAITQQQQSGGPTKHQLDHGAPNPNEGRQIKLRSQLIVSRDDSVSALISGNDCYEGSLVRLNQAPNKAASHSESDPRGPIERRFICAKSPLDADSVWDFWRLIYEREVRTLVMLTPNEDVHTGDLRCAQYWPTCDNEETTILSPCNEFVQSSSILPAKFKIRQETLATLSELEGRPGRPEQPEQQLQFKVRRLTLLVMATKLSENEHIVQAQQAANSNAGTSTNGTTNSGGANTVEERRQSNQNGELSTNGRGASVEEKKPAGLLDKAQQNKSSNGSEELASLVAEEEDDEEKLIIVERTILHFQFLHWNASSSSNQTKLIKFIEFVNERHAKQLQQLASPGASWQQMGSRSPILVHCANGLGRSGLFVAMSHVIDELRYKLLQQQQLIRNASQQTTYGAGSQQLLPKINLFQLVARLRNQRDMLLSPYRFYELLYQLTSRCIPVQQQQLQ